MPRADRAAAALTWVDQRTQRFSNRAFEWGERTAAFVGRRLPETVIVLMALALRFSLVATYHPNRGYDAYDHYVYVQWFTRHWTTMPSLFLSRCTYHPPLYYWLASFFSRLVHAETSLLGLPSMVFSSATLLLTWYGLERYLPGRRPARIVGLVLAAIMPPAVHVAGMVSAEALNALLATAALLVAAAAMERQQQGASVSWRCAVLGVLVGMQMLTKISAVVVLAAIGGAIGLDLVLRSARIGERARRAAPWLLVIAVCGATSGWYFMRNHRLYGKVMLSGYDGPERRLTPPLATPYLKRRPASFYYGWNNDALMRPYAPAGQSPRSYFWPVLVAATFSDYYNYGFVREPREGRVETGNWKPLRPAALTASRASAFGGAVIAASTAVAWFWVLIVSLRRRQTAHLVFLLAPALAILGQLHFVVQYPFDFEGPIKGAYLQFAAGPLFALFGLAVYKMMQRRATWPIAVVQCAALVAVASYTIYARVFAF